MKVKTCSKCKEEKSVKAFYLRKGARDGLKSWCKLCFLEDRKKYRKKNSSKIKEKAKEYRNKNIDKTARWRRDNKEKIKRYPNEYAIYSTYYHQLTIDEESQIADDGVSLEVKCKYCGKHFKPTNERIRSRIKALVGITGGDSYLYCSEGCKYSCPIYGQILYPKGFKPATSREVQPQLRKIVLERDNWTCQKCGNKDYLHCHHIDPVINNPIESADVDNCITYCVKCHKESHKGECSTGNLSNCS